VYHASRSVRHGECQLHGRVLREQLVRHERQDGKQHCQSVAEFDLALSSRACETSTLGRVDPLASPEPGGRSSNSDHALPPRMPIFGVPVLVGTTCRPFVALPVRHEGETEDLALLADLVYPFPDDIGWQTQEREEGVVGVRKERGGGDRWRSGGLGEAEPMTWVRTIRGIARHDMT
jgi:hypothetical protein